MATFRAPMQAADVAALNKLKPQTSKIDFQSGGTGSDVFFTASGLTALAETLRSMPKYARDAAGYEMAEIAHEVIEDARDNYVPLKWGNLRDSGNADEYNPGMGAEVTQIAMWFGAPMSEKQKREGMQLGRADHGTLRTVDVSDYAEKQHENLQYHHSPPPDLTGPKYLEKPLNKITDQIAPRIARAVGIAWGVDTPVAPITSAGAE